MFDIFCCDALTADKCGTMCRSDKSIKRYQRGRQQIETRLDIVKLIKSSMNLEMLSKLYLLPR